MNKLWGRLTLAFTLVAMIGIGIAIALTNWQISTHFRRFVAYNQMLDSPLVEVLVEYYAQHNNWADVQTIFEAPGKQYGLGYGIRHRSILADETGQVLYGQTNAPYFTMQQQQEAISIVWQNQTVGYLLIGTSNSIENSMEPPMDMSPAAQAFLDEINLVFLQAVLLTVGICGLLGFFVARGLTAPLGQLADAARQIAQGELGQRVVIKGATEIANLAHDFNEMAQSLQQAETMRRNLVADIAHELRTPLTVIQGNLQAILDGVYPLDKAEIATIYDETLMLHRLVTDLRDLAQAEAGQLSLNLTSLEIAPIVQNVADFFAGMAQEQDLHLAVHLDPDLPLVQADADRVRQILYNLLTNAVRYTPKNGQITLTARPQGAQVKISVQDNGTGIAADDLPHVFDRFWRGDKSRARQHGGSGLGLAIAKQLVQVQGGQIGVTSEVGHGSEFWFTLKSKE